MLLRVILLQVGTGYSLRETTVRAKLANWPPLSDVAFLKHFRKSEEWLRSLCRELLHSNSARGGAGGRLKRVVTIHATKAAGDSGEVSK